MRKVWHRADVIAELNKKGWSLRRLSVAWGLAPDTLKNVFYRRYPRGERIIALTIGVSPEVIFGDSSATPIGVVDGSKTNPTSDFVITPQMLAFVNAN